MGCSCAMVDLNNLVAVIRALKHGYHNVQEAKENWRNESITDIRLE